ncbi:MAG: glycine cleavage system protein GcvH [Acidimicrobiia bacterium]
MNVPDHLRYTEEHEWVETLDSGNLRVGITDYAQDQLGDVVFVELSPAGDVEAGAMLAEVESTKSVAEVYAPVPGSIVELNGELADAPELVNSDPYGRGWFVVIEPSADDGGVFLDAGGYRSLIE